MASLCATASACAPAHAGVFLGQHLHSLTALDLGPGDTAFLPGGWLSASAAVEATLAVGGVWMQTATLPVQLQAWSIEVSLAGTAAPLLEAMLQSRTGHKPPHTKLIPQHAPSDVPAMQELLSLAGTCSPNM